MVENCVVVFGEPPSAKRNICSNLSKSLKGNIHMIIVHNPDLRSLKKLTTRHSLDFM